MYHFLATWSFTHYSSSTRHLQPKLVIFATVFSCCLATSLDSSTRRFFCSTTKTILFRSTLLRTKNFWSIHPHRLRSTTIPSWIPPYILQQWQAQQHAILPWHHRHGLTYIRSIFDSASTTILLMISFIELWTWPTPLPFQILTLGWKHPKCFQQWHSSNSL